MSTFISSPDDDDDIMITLLLLAMCYPPVNKTPSFRESLTVDEVRRRSGKIRCHALQHPLSSPFWTLFNSKHDDALITLCGFDHASFELLHQLFKPCFYSFTPCRKNTDFIVRNSTTKKGRQRYLLFHQLSSAWVSMDQDSWFLYDSSDYFRINSWFFECLVEVFKANDCKSTADT